MAVTEGPGFNPSSPSEAAVLSTNQSYSKSRVKAEPVPCKDPAEILPIFCQKRLLPSPPLETPSPQRAAHSQNDTGTLLTQTFHEQRQTTKMVKRCQVIGKRQHFPMAREKALIGSLVRRGLVFVYDTSVPEQTGPPI